MKAALGRTRTWPTKQCLLGNGIMVAGVTIRLAGALLPGQNDEWAVQRVRTMTLETIAPLGDECAVSVPVPAT